MSCPAACIHVSSDKEWNIDNCRWEFLTDKKKLHYTFWEGRIIGLPLPDYNTPEERFDKISNIFCGLIQVHGTKIGIEDYSFGSKGKVFHIAENCGVLKHKLYKLGFTAQLFAPTTIKKFAYGKGNADKIKMCEAFKRESESTYEKFKLYLDVSDGKSPLADMIDAYYVAKYLYSLS